jgi:hypothetical protein
MLGGMTLSKRVFVPGHGDPSLTATMVRSILNVQASLSHPTFTCSIYAYANVSIPSVPILPCRVVYSPGTWVDFMRAHVSTAPFVGLLMDAVIEERFSVVVVKRPPR